MVLSDCFNLHFLNDCCNQAPKKIIEVFGFFRFTGCLDILFFEMSIQALVIFFFFIGLSAFFLFIYSLYSEKYNTDLSKSIWFFCRNVCLVFRFFHLRDQ